MKPVISLGTIALALCLPCAAKDAVQASVTPLSGSPIVAQNGNPYSVGTYAVGTVQLFYTVVATQFPAGPLATFQVGLLDKAYNDKPATLYPVALNLSQIGFPLVELSAAPGTFNVAAAGPIGSSVVTVSIPAATAANPALNLDGTELVGNLKLDTDPAGNHLDTVTNIQVHVKLVYPDTACLRLFDFITDEAFTTTVTSTVVNVGGHPAKVVSTNPYGQFSDNLLVVNTCAASKTFDLTASLDSRFATNPQGNPGNAAFTYLKTGYVDPTSFSIGAFGTGTPAGQQLCLQNVTLPAGDSLLMAVHMGIVKGQSPTLLPASGVFSFLGSLYGPGTNCSGTLESQVAPNPAAATLGFTVQ
jgi:hypothetical protein